MTVFAAAPDARFQLRLAVAAFGRVARHPLTTIALLSALFLAVPTAIGIAVMGRLDCTKTELARDGAYQIASALELYRAHVGAYPAPGEHLTVLVQPPTGKPIIDDVEKLKDQWGQEYAYRIPGIHNPAKFDVRSAGPDGFFFTEDDIGNWRDE
jgi:hypothetical protein